MASKKQTTSPKEQAELQKAKDSLLKKYVAYVEKHNSIPSLSQLAAIGITRNAIRHHFGSNTQLYQYVKKNHSDSLVQVVDESHFTPRRFAEIKKEASQFDRFVITTAVVEKGIHQGFYDSIKNYCKRNNALLLILPCQDVASRKTHFDWTLAPELHSEYIVFGDLALNSNVWISAIKMSAKQINPLTGLSRISQKNGSTIYASPKQQLEYVTTSARKKIPRALMSTGAITKNDYSTERYMSARTSYIAENDHVLGAIVVETKNNKQFFFRQIQADEKTGSFPDASIMYHPDGSVEAYAPKAIVWGDYHSGVTDPNVKRVTKELVMATRPEEMIMHDFFDGKSISHHDMKKPLTRARKAMDNQLSLQNEIRFMRDEIDELSTWTPGSLIMVKSNHDEVLERFLKEGRYVNDDHNHYYSLELAKRLLEGVDPLQYAIESVEGLKNKDQVVWLQRDEEYRIANVECGAHGDGWQSSMTFWEKSLGNCVIGHAHTAAILRGVFRVGTSSLLQLDYNIGPSSWTHTHCLVYPNGARQLINIINGEWRLTKGAMTLDQLQAKKKKAA